MRRGVALQGDLEDCYSDAEEDDSADDVAAHGTPVCSTPWYQSQGSVMGSKCPSISSTDADEDNPPYELPGWLLPASMQAGQSGNPLGTDSPSSESGFSDVSEDH
mmetsp:Transcript_33538/g.79810  ORF Transcript_33538/g.79810 Transcript_33538/m.79810 type:complete len:105 (+) Transcript_33538:68-382(+)